MPENHIGASRCQVPHLNGSVWWKAEQPLSMLGAAKPTTTTTTTLIGLINLATADLLR